MNCPVGSAGKSLFVVLVSLVERNLFLPWLIHDANDDACIELGIGKECALRSPMQTSPSPSPA